MYTFSVSSFNRVAVRVALYLHNAPVNGGQQWWCFPDWHSNFLEILIIRSSLMNFQQWMVMNMHSTLMCTLWQPVNGLSSLWIVSSCQFMSVYDCLWQWWQSVPIIQYSLVNMAISSFTLISIISYEHRFSLLSSLDQSLIGGLWVQH